METRRETALHPPKHRISGAAKLWFTLISNKVQAQVSPFSEASRGACTLPLHDSFNLTAPNKPNFTEQPLESPWKLINALMKSLTVLFA